MNEKQIPETICRSVFKSGENTTSKSQFTQKWIELVNKIEKKQRANSQRAIMTSRFLYGIITV